jgi:hypothetical protein
MKKLIRSMLVKRAGFAFMFYLICGLSFSQSLTGSYTSDFNLPQDELKIESEDEKLSSFSLSLNAGDFLVMGPLLQADFRIARNTYIGVFYVYHYMGLFAGPLIFEKDITAYSPKSMGAGITAKHYFKPNEKQNAWYCGIYLGYSYNEAFYHSGYPNERVERLDDILLFASGGYRWNLGKRFYLLTGLQLGIAYTFKDNIYSSYTLNPETGTYVKEESFHMKWPSEIYPYPLPELTIGINF